VAAGTHNVLVSGKRNKTEAIVNDQKENVDYPPTPAEIAYGIFCVLAIIGMAYGGVWLMAIVEGLK
jgi:hypothetical protein